MQFAPKRKKPTTEERMARWSIGLLGGSIVIVAVLVALAFTVATKSNWLPLAAACLCTYVAQFYYLGSIGKYEPKQRLHIWQLSLLGHFFLYGVVLWVVGEPSVALVVLLPEAASGAIHLVAISHAVKASRAA
jgi:hypothetical protein